MQNKNTEPQADFHGSYINKDVKNVRKLRHVHLGHLKKKKKLKKKKRKKIQRYSFVIFSEVEIRYIKKPICSYNKKHFLGHFCVTDRETEKRRNKQTNGKVVLHSCIAAAKNKQMQQKVLISFICKATKGQKLRNF